MSHPDPDDMTTAKRGSDHDRAEAWRIIAHDLKAERDKARDYARIEVQRKNAAVEECGKARLHAADCERLVTAAEHDLDAERMKRVEAEAENARLDRLLRLACRMWALCSDATAGEALQWLVDHDVGGGEA